MGSNFVDQVPSGAGPSLINVDYLALQRNREKEKSDRADKTVLAASVFSAMVLAASILMETMDRMPEESVVTVDIHLDNQAESIRGAMDEQPYASMHRPDAAVAKTKIAYWINQNWGTGVIRAHQFIDYAFEAGETHGVDPVLVLAIIAKESSFKPDAKSSVGAEGLMQVWRKWHKEKFAGLGKQVSPAQNVLIGTQILREYLDRESWNEERALQRYNGSLSDRNKEYSSGVLTFYRALDRVYRAAADTQLEASHNNARGYRS